MATTRPARSEPHLPPEEAARVEAEVRGYFDSVAPRRPAKPPRSDPSEDAVAAGVKADAGGNDLPELRKLRDLEAKPQKLVLDGGDVDGGEEEYVETRYYDGLNSSTSSITRLVQALSKWRDPMATRLTWRPPATHLPVLSAARATLLQTIGFHLLRRSFQLRTSLAGATPEPGRVSFFSVV